MARHPGSQPPPRADLGSRSSQVHWDRRVLFAKRVRQKESEPVVATVHLCPASRFAPAVAVGSSGIHADRGYVPVQPAVGRLHMLASLSDVGVAVTRLVNVLVSPLHPGRSTTDGRDRK